MDDSIEHPLLNGAIANAQKKIETETLKRKQILEYDDVSNDQGSLFTSLEIIFLMKMKLIS